MDLHSGAPYWLLVNSLEERTAQLPRTIDVAILGCGITGALVADRLTECGARVAIFDRGAPGEGSTAACTALLQPEIDVELVKLARLIGPTDAAMIYQVCRAAVAELEELARSLGESTFHRRDCLYLASRPRDGARLLAEAAMRLEHDVPVEALSAERLETEYGLPSHGGLRTQLAALVDPVSLTRKLVERAVARGAGLASRCRVVKVTQSGAGLIVETERRRHHAQQVVFATGYEVPPCLRPDIVSLHTSYALVTEPFLNRERAGKLPIVWETARPYSYLRATDDGRVVIGGMDLPFTDPAERERRMPERTQRLERRLRRWIPAAAPTAYVWAGTFAESSDGLPFVGPVPGLDGGFAALGYGGNGILFGAIAAQVLGDALGAKPNALGQLLRLDR